MQRIDIGAITPIPWKNGAGLTRELAVSAPRSNQKAPADFDWRISVAEVERDAPFSEFPGIDRCIVLLRGSGMVLRADDESFEHRLDHPLVPFRFAGEVGLSATLLDGPCSDFNVMTQRGEYRCEVDVYRGDAEVIGGDITLILCAEGEWQVESADPEQGCNMLAPMQALLWRRSVQRITLRVSKSNASAALLLVSLCHDRSR